jgi:hypothetical protein
MKDPKYDTSLYNHKPISDGSKPLISNSEYKTVLMHVENGNYDAYYDAEKNYFIEPKQRKILLDIINKNII